jgi:hypothetical protein
MDKVGIEPTPSVLLIIKVYKSSAKDVHAQWGYLESNQDNQPRIVVVLPLHYTPYPMLLFFLFLLSLAFIGKWSTPFTFAARLRTTLSGWWSVTESCRGKPCPGIEPG